MTQTGSTTAPEAVTPTTTAPTTPTRRSLREAEAREAQARRSAQVRRAGTTLTTTATGATAAGATATASTPVAHATAPITAAGATVLNRPSQATATAPRRTVARSATGPVTTATGAVVKKTAPVSKRRRFLPAVVMTLTAGLFGTMALPAFASTQADADGSSSSAAAQTTLRTTNSQSVTVSDTAALADTSRDAYTATDPAVLAAAAAKTAAVNAARATVAASYAKYTGPTAEQYAANPAYPTFSLDQVVAVGKQYIGTPYVYGGATPAGFDCSGFVMFVYAQFGIKLAHSVPLQDAAGTRINEADAVPGDIVVFNSEAHDGIYMGNGMIMDAPKPGGYVSIRPIWSSSYHIVRLGISK